MNDRRYLKKSSVTIILIITVALFFSSEVNATLITLSDLSSDETSAALLNARIDISVSGSTLTIAATNDTEFPNEYLINAIGFNASDDVTDLELDEVVSSLGDPTDEWILVADTTVNGGVFGEFDFVLEGGVGEKDLNLIQPGETVTFTLDISGSNPFYASDFIHLSTTPPGDHPTVLAAKFVSGGPYDDSAVGAVPDASIMFLLGPSLIVLGLFSRRKFRK